MSSTPADRQQCRATRTSGEPCKGKPLADGLCFAHSNQSPAWRVKGGRNRSNAARSLKALPERLKPVADLLSDSLQEVHTGKLKPQQATAMAALAGALVRVLQAGEVEERLKNLEAALAGTDATA